MKKILIPNIIGMLIELFLIIHYVFPETGKSTTVAICVLFLSQRVQHVSREIKKLNESLINEFLIKLKL